MKVLVVTTWLPTRERPEVGSFVARDIALLHRDHEVRVLHLSAGGGTLPLPGDVPVRTVSMSPKEPFTLIRAARIIEECSRSVDLVHSMAASALLPFRSVTLRCPWVHTEHWSALLAPSTAPLAARLAIPETRRLLAKPDVVISVGNDLSVAVGRYRSGATVVIPNEVERPVVVKDRRSESGIVLVGVGGLVERKGAGVAIAAVADLRSRGIDASLRWAGDGPERAALEELAARLGVQDSVELRGRVEPSEVAAVIAEGDVFILPTRMETFGVAIAEALVAGRPVVVGAEGEQASFVSEPDGILVGERTAAAYADAVLRVLRLNAGRSAQEIAARTRERFDPERRRADTVDAYALAVQVSGSPEPDVDVIIAVHDAGRRIDRAIASALTSECVERVIVICHNVDVPAIRAAARESTADPRVEFVEFIDGIRSPGGPFNHGLGLARGRFVTIMGSDDELTAGAVDAWRHTAARDGAQVVIAPLRHAGGPRVPTPPTIRRRRLRGARDRLAYRTAPLGLIDRRRFGGLRFTPGVSTGEDLAYSTRLWFSGARISRHRGEGDYLIHDGEGRVTFTRRPVADELRAVELLIADPRTEMLAAADRAALATKIWRTTIFGAVHYRAGDWGEGDRTAVASLVAALEDFSPAALGVLSRADIDLKTALASVEVSDGRVDALSRRRRRFASLPALLPARLSRVLARDAPLRFVVATWWASRS